MQSKIFSFRNFLSVASLIIVIAIVNYFISSKTGQIKSSDLASSTDLAVSNKPSLLTKKTIVTPQGSLQVEVADTPASEELGLGGRTSLANDSGMLFVFAEPGIFSFWMKDMNFPLDMIWIGADKRVSGVTANISADSYPIIYSPTVPVSYVLELNAGAATRYGIATGTLLFF